MKSKWRYNIRLAHRKGVTVREGTHDDLDTFGELMRVTKPGGTILILDFGIPRNKWVRAIYFAYLKLGVPLLGKLICGDSAAYGYILDSLHRYPGQYAVDKQLIQTGGIHSQVINVLFGSMSINICKKAESTNV